MASSDANVVSAVRGRVAEVLDRQGALRCPHPIVVGVSGGPDSLSLLDAVVAVVPDAQRRIRAAHVDHLLRPGSSEDAEHVKQVALSLGVSGTVDTVNVSALATAERIGIEEAARIGRYRSLSKFALYVDACFLLTGHTCDDQVETIVHHLIRGTGLRGLSGMAEMERLAAWTFLYTNHDTIAGPRLLRPLLRVGRDETLAYCEARGLRYLVDESNADPAFTRNRIRAHLLPVLRTYNPSVDRALTRMAHVLRDENVWLDEMAIEHWADLRVDSGVDEVLDLAGWRALPLALQRRIVRLMAQSLGCEDIGFDAVERAIAVGANGGPPQAELGGGLAVRRERETLFFDSSAIHRHTSRGERG